MGTSYRLRGEAQSATAGGGGGFSPQRTIRT